MPSEKKCPQCGAYFECKSDATDCWCSKLPNIIPLTEGAECLCKNCLTKKILEFGTN